MYCTVQMQYWFPYREWQTKYMGSTRCMLTTAVFSVSGAV